MTEHMNIEATTVLASLIRHQKHVETNCESLAGEIRGRGIIHDQSKMSPDELSGFVEIHQIARKHALGTPEYEAAMRSADCIKRHFSHNSHHPEHHASTSDMGWLDIIEMVLDWKAAADTYGLTPFRDGLAYQRERHGFTAEQWWLITQVAEWIDPLHA